MFTKIFALKRLVSSSFPKGTENQYIECDTASLRKVDWKCTTAICFEL